MNNTLRLIGLSVIISLVLAACGDSKGAGQKAPPPVQVAAYRSKIGNRCVL